MHSNTFSMDAIATIRSCYSQRFGIPRQPGLVESAVAAIEFEPTSDNELALRDLGSFSHLWVVFVFHRQHYTRFKPLVQPPRLGGKTTMGVYATRIQIEPDSDIVASGSLGLKSLIEQTLAQDPRPAHERGKYGKQGQQWGVMITRCEHSAKRKFCLAEDLLRPAHSKKFSLRQRKNGVLA